MVHAGPVVETDDAWPLLQALTPSSQLRSFHVEEDPHVFAEHKHRAEGRTPDGDAMRTSGQLGRPFSATPLKNV